MNERSMGCGKRRCPVCYPKWQEEEQEARRKAAEDKQDCINCWLNLQKRAEEIASSADPVARNRRINAAYAQLWWNDRRFQWAGLAAFASKQVGCGLLNAADMIKKSNRQRDAYQRWEKETPRLERMSPYGSPRMPLPDQAAGEAATRVYQMLGKGNTALFLDIWPLHMFYREFGLARFKRCLPERQLIKSSVWWPIGESVPFGTPRKEIEDGFAAIDRGDIKASVVSLARHEQLNILQPAMYNDPLFTNLLRANQLAWALHIPTGSAQEIQLTLANKCTLNGANANSEVFSKQPLADLADPVQRMAFVLRAADRFDELLRHSLQKYDVENSIYLIAHMK
ncbi:MULTISPECIES: DUF2515 family protein [Paraburkholderia]|nr:hypothetical protein [Paraburkholderia sp. GV072]